MNVKPAAVGCSSPTDSKSEAMGTEEERRKREIFDSMSPRRQRRILEKGYEKWDPFQPPKEPPLFSQEERRRLRLTAEKFRRFLQQAAPEGLQAGASSLYVQAAREMAFGLARGEERFQAMFDYCRWLVLEDEREKGSLEPEGEREPE